MITNIQFDEFKQELQTLIDLYKQEFSGQKLTNWQLYEKQWANRLRTALDEIKATINQAAQAIRVSKHFGRPPLTSAKQKTLILLQKDLAQFSNRKMADLMPMFSLLTEVETSYKTIERAYSDPMVRMITHNMFVILVRKKRISQVHLTGDGTGYGLTITRHYRSVRKKQAKAAKVDPKKRADSMKKQEKTRLFTYAFALMDLDSHMYVGYGASIKSERDAFARALELMRECCVEVKSVRLDKYYGTQSTATLLVRTRLCLLFPRAIRQLGGLMCGRVW